MNIKDILALNEPQTMIDELKRGRKTDIPDIETYKNQLSVLQHKIVTDKISRPDKKIYKPAIDQDGNTKLNIDGSPQMEFDRYEPVARVSLALQKVIVNRAVSFLFGNDVKYLTTPTTENEKAFFYAFKQVLKSNKDFSLNRNIARNVFSCTEVAEMWYKVDSEQHNKYGFPCNFKLRCSVFSPLNGDTLYPMFDDYGDLVAFSRAYQVKDDNNKSVDCFDTYTAEKTISFRKKASGWNVTETPNEIGKIPIIYSRQEKVEWADVQGLIERLETILSNFADTNDYHSSPKIILKGNVVGFMNKGESGGVIQLEGDGADAQYLSWNNAPESVRMEIDNLLEMIYTLTQTPDISFESVRGIGSISGTALQLLFMDACLKVEDKKEIFIEHLQRRTSILKKMISLAHNFGDGANFDISPSIEPYTIKDNQSLIQVLSTATQGKASMSQYSAVSLNPFVENTEDEMNRINEEAKNDFTQPTI